MTRRSRALLCPVVATVALHYFALGCGSSASRDGHPDRGNTPPDAGSPGAGGAGGEGEGAGSGAGGALGSVPEGRAGAGGETTETAGGGGPASGDGAEAAGGAAATSPCAERLPRRLVRLTWDQLSNSIERLLGPDLAAELRDEHDIAAGRGVFSGLRSGREGHSIGETQWFTADAMADAAGTWVEGHFEEVSGCGEDLGCARDFVAAFTEAAFRRPPSDEELNNVLSVFDDAVELDASAALAARYGVYAALSSPLFLYRTELGLAEAGPLEPMTSYELASALSFFLTNRPPDEELLEKAAAGALDSKAGLSAEVDRLLSSELAHRNLEQAMADYLGLYRAEQVLLDASSYPEFSTELRTSAVGEGHRFLASELWSSPLGSLITSQRTFVNAELAALYGVPFPPEGATLDTEGFAAIQLEQERAGVMTQLAFLLTSSRANGPSVVARGLRVNGMFACGSVPPLKEVSSETMLPPPDATQRELAALRAEDPNCSSCHTLFDPYGLVLDAYDALARHRTVDEAGNPIDPVVALPELVGGQTVANANELGEVLVSSGRLSLCLAQGFAAHAFVDDALGACVSESVVAEPAFVEEPTFSELVRLIALSEPFRLRAPETP